MSDKILNLNASFDVTNKALDEDDLIIEGYANTTDKDRVGDVVVESAWKQGGLDNYLKNPIILGFHNYDNPIGVMEGHEVNSKGLFISAKISKAAGRVYDLIKEGILRTFSIGFRVLEADYDSDTDIFVIKDLELLEVSVVSVPANQFSIFNVRKSFENETDYDQFKKEFIKDEDPIIPQEEEDMPLSAEEKQKIQDEAVEAFKAEEARKKAEEDRLKSLAVEVNETAADKIMGEVNSKLEEKDASMETALAEINKLKEELKANSEELLAMHNSKMHFTDNRASTVSSREKDDAVLLAKVLNKGIEDTKLGRSVVEKSDGTHQSMTEDWEQEFSTRMLEDMELRLVVEPLFTNIPMNTVSMHMPTNPAAGYAQWITTFATTDGTSTGADENHVLGDVTLTAHKLASKDRVSYEEEEDLIVPFLGLIRDAAIERMAKASDNALLVGDAGVASPSNATFANVYPFDGIGTLAVDDSTPVVVSSAKTTALELQATRRLMGKYGLNPADVVYVVNQGTYYDLLEDTEFRTVEKVGNAATALRGQVGEVNGIPVVVSGEFPAEGSSTLRAVCVNMRNYIKGTLRGLMVERDRDIENQTNVIVATRRMGMLELFPGGTGNYSCAALVTAA